MEKSGSQLKKGTLSLGNCIMLAVGGMVGAAIFTLSGVTYFNAGPSAILSWIIAGGILLLYSLNVAELATIFPESGGIYLYPYKILGKTEPQKRFAGWITAWSRLNPGILGTSFSALFISHYLSSIIPAAEGHQIAIALFFIFIVWLLNVIGVTFTGKINAILTLSLVTVCVIYILFGLPAINFANMTPFVGGTSGTKGIFASIPVAMLAYGTVIAIASVAGEIKDPKKTVPKAMGYSVLLTVLMYGLILFVTYGMTDYAGFASNPYNMYAPLDYAIRVSLPTKVWLYIIVALGAILALITTMLMCIMGASRNIMAAGQTGTLPKFLGKVNSKTQTPISAITATSLIAGVIACFPQFLNLIVGTGAFCSAVTILILIITLLTARKKKITAPGAFRVPGGIIIPIITFGILAATMTMLDPKAIMVAIWWYVTGIVIYAVGYFTYNNKKVDEIEKA